MDESKTKINEEIISLTKRIDAGDGESFKHEIKQVVDKMKAANTRSAKNFSD